MKRLLAATGVIYLLTGLSAGQAFGAGEIDPVASAIKTFSGPAETLHVYRAAMHGVVENADADALGRLLGEARSTRDENSFYWCCKTVLEIDKEKHGPQIEKLVLERIRHFLSGDHEECHAAIEAALEAGDEKLAQRLATGHKLTPRTVELLGECASEASAETLAKLAGDSSAPSLRAPALRTFAATADPRSAPASVDVMLGALASGSDSTRRAAGDAIAVLAERSGLPGEIAKRLVSALDADADAALAERLVRTLGEIDSRASRTKIKALIRSEKRTRVLAEALKAAGALKMKDAASDILRIAKGRRHPTSIRELALRTLGAVGADSAAETLVEMLDQDDARLKAAAHGSLRRITKKNHPPSADVWMATVRRCAEERDLGRAEDASFGAGELSAPRRRPAAATVAAGGGFWQRWLYPVIGVGALGAVALLFMGRGLLIKRQVATIEARRKKHRRGTPQL